MDPLWNRALGPFSVIADMNLSHRLFISSQTSSDYPLTHYQHWSYLLLYFIKYLQFIICLLSFKNQFESSSRTCLISKTSSLVPFWFLWLDLSLKVPQCLITLSPFTWHHCLIQWHFISTQKRGGNCVTIFHHSVLALPLSTHLYQIPLVLPIHLRLLSFACLARVAFGKSCISVKVISVVL